MKSILQDWVMNLGLRHQGVLLTAVRGCDSAPKEDPSKALVRAYRAAILNAHCGDPKKAATFIEVVTPEELQRRMTAFRKSCDHYPHHYVMHMIHAAQVVGTKGPRVEPVHGPAWLHFYGRMCHSLHMNYETEQEMDDRLNADEATFAARDWTCDGEPKGVNQ